MDNERKMSILTLQRELCKEIREITSDLQMKQPGSTELTAPRVFGQDLPIPRKKDEDIGYGDTDIPDEEDQYGIGFLFPWILVKLDLGNVSASNERQRISVILVIGVFDDDLEANGHERIVIIVERIMERFAKDPLLGGQIVAVPVDDDHMFRWSLQDENTHPQYFGALEMAFEMPGFEREDYYGFA